MKSFADPKAFGRRVKERRLELGWSQDQLAEASGYSQTNIDWIEKGGPKRPRIQAAVLAGPLRTSEDWLLWEKGSRNIGPQIMSPEEVSQNYSMLDMAVREAISALIREGLEATREKRKIS